MKPANDEERVMSSLLFRASLSGILLLLTASAASAQQYMMLPPNSVIGNVTGQSAPGRVVPLQELNQALNLSANRAAVQPFLQSGPFTLLGNQSSAKGPIGAIDVTALPSKPGPVPADVVLLQDSQAGNAFKRTTVGAIGSVGSVSDIAGATGSISLDQTCITISGNELKLVVPLPAACGSVSSIAGATGALTISGLLALNSKNLEVDAASKVQQQAATSAAVAVTPAHQQDHASAAKAWVKFVGSNGNINSTPYNVSGSAVTRAGTGAYSISFVTPFASNDYACSVQSMNTQAIGYLTAEGTGTISVQFVNLSGTAVDPGNVSVACFGQQ
jgi:hypothetical protein